VTARRGRMRKLRKSLNVVAVSDADCWRVQALNRQSDRVLQDGRRKGRFRKCSAELLVSCCTVSSLNVVEWNCLSHLPP